MNLYSLLFFSSLSQTVKIFSVNSNCNKNSNACVSVWSYTYTVHIHTYAYTAAEVFIKHVCSFVTVRQSDPLWFNHHCYTANLCGDYWKSFPLSREVINHHVMSHELFLPPNDSKVLLLQYLTRSEDKVQINVCGPTWKLQTESEPCGALFYVFAHLKPCHSSFHWPYPLNPDDLYATMLLVLHRRSHSLPWAKQDQLTRNQFPNVDLWIFVHWGTRTVDHGTRRHDTAGTSSLFDLNIIYHNSLCQL